MSKNKDAMTTERWRYLKALRPGNGKLAYSKTGTIFLGRNAYKRKRKLYNESLGKVHKGEYIPAPQKG